MFRRGFALMLLPCVFLALGCATGESYLNPDYDFSKVKKIAVVEVLGDFHGEATKNQLADFVHFELLKKGYSPIERKQVQALLKEQDFEASGRTAEADAAEIGRILNVPNVVIMNVSAFEERISMTVKMLDTETAELVWMGSGEGSTQRTLITVVGAIVGGITGIFVGGSGSGGVIGGAAGGVLGGVAGSALSPSQQRVAQKMIRKICTSLPIK